MSAPDWLQRMSDELGPAITQIGRYVDALPGIGGLVVIVGVGLGAVVALNAIWAAMRASMGEPSREAVRLVAARLAETMRSGAPPAPALAGMRPLLPWPHPGRLGAAARELEGAAPPSLVAALLGNRLLPSALAPLALGAERLGPQVLEGWLRALASEPRLRRSFYRRLAPPLLTLIGLVGIALFLGTFLAPRWTWIGRDLGVQLRGMDTLSMIADHGWSLAALVAVPIAVGVACWARWRWLLELRLMRAETIVQAVQVGLPEDAIAAALSLPRPEGSLAALCLAAGWPVRDADELAVALAATRRRRERAAALAMSVLEIIAPLVVALPVLALARAIFGGVIAIIDALAGSL